MGEHITLTLRDMTEVILEMTPELNQRLEDVMDAVVVPAAKERAPMGEGGQKGKGEKGSYVGHMRDTIVFVPYKRHFGGGFHAAFPAWFHENGTVRLERTPFMGPAIANNMDAIMEGLRD